MTDWTHFSVPSPTGATLSVYECAPAKPRAVVQVNHGLAEHGSRYERFARFLAGRGFATIVHDHRGHGGTRAPDAQLGQFGKPDGLGKVIADIHTINAFAAGRYFAAPVICFGQSMGGIMAMNYALRYPGTIAACAVWNTDIQTSPMLSIAAALLKAERMFKGSDVPSKIASRLTFEAWNREFAPNRTDFDWLSRDHAEVDKYVADPLCGFNASVGAWLDILAAIRFGANRGNWESLPRKLPMNLVAGAADPCGDHGKAILNLAERLKAAGMTDIHVTIYPDTRHEGLNETNRDAVMQAFADWLDRIA